MAYHKKMNLVHRKTDRVAVAELKVWKVQSSEYPEGIKYSMFLTALDSGEIIIGMDNHDPKGPHLHRRGCEVSYDSDISTDSLVDNFWKLAKEEGFEP
ncbi:MAG: hypothetical protein HY537_12770 [Deltaproteobacteria bacterium]|nr:hypothetical protein [Deltaproteobacteria bacterium]